MSRPYSIKRSPDDDLRAAQSRRQSEAATMLKLAASLQSEADEIAAELRRRSIAATQPEVMHESSDYERGVAAGGG